MNKQQEIQRKMVEAVLYRLCVKDVELDCSDSCPPDQRAINEFASMYLQDMRLLLADFAEHFSLAETVRKDPINPEIIGKVSPELAAEVAALPVLDLEKRRLIRDFERAQHSNESQSLCDIIESDPFPPVSIPFSEPTNRDKLEKFVFDMECLNLCLYTSETEPRTPKGSPEDLAETIADLQIDIEACGEELDPEFYNDESEKAGALMAYEIVADSLNRLRHVTPKTPYYTGITAKDLPAISGFTTGFEPVGIKYLN